MLKLLSRNTGLIGVDVGAQCIKVAQLVRRSGELVLDQAIVLGRSTTVQGNGPAAGSFEARDMGELLRGCDQFSGRSAAATLSMLACEYKSEPVDGHVGSGEIEQIARRLAARESRLAGQLQHDHWTTSGGGQGRSLLHVLATPAHLAVDIAQQHRAAGLQCVALDGLPTALARAVRLAGHPDNGPVAAIDWGCSRVTICVVLGGKPVFVRSFARGAFAGFIEPTCKTLNLTLREARQLLCTVGLPLKPQASTSTKTQSTIAQCIATSLQEFNDELQRTLSFLQGRQRAYYPQQIVLFGGGATVANIAPYVSRAAGLPVDVWNYPHVDAAKGSAASVPLALLGPAIALSALAWEIA